MKPKDLEALAKELKLTAFQIAFCHHLAADPSRNRTNAVIAAKAQVGYPKPSDNTARQEGARTHAKANVQKYMQALTQAALVRVQKEAVAGLQENLERLTRMARGELATETRTYHVREDAGKPRLVRTLNRFDRAGASDMLVKHHTGAYAQDHLPPPTPGVTLNLAVLSLEDLWKLKELRAKVLGVAPEES